MSTTARAYSYIRFSTPEQAQGDSLRRQTALAEEYAKKHGLVLDKELSMRDLGKSAWRGKNMDDTAKLGMFVRMLEDGDIPAGSVLLLEKLDRASRDYPLEAANTIARIIKAGCDVVTLDPEKRYGVQTIRGDIGALLTMIIAFAVANEESEKKSTRGRQANAAKRERKAPMGYGRNRDAITGIAPGWIQVEADGNRVLIPERAKVVRHIFELFVSGTGQQGIAKAFTRDKLPTFGRSSQWHKSYIAKILRSQTVIGTLTHVDGTRREGYYPAAIDGELWQRAQTLIETDGRRAGRPKGSTLLIRNVLAGLAKCPKCGNAMTRVWKGSSRKKAGVPKLVCTWAKLGGTWVCPYVSVSLPMIEAALQRAARTPLPKADETLRDQLQNRHGELEGIESVIEDLVAAVEKSASKALLKRLKEREEQRDRLSAELAVLEKQAEDSDSKLFKRRVERYRAAMTAKPFDVGAANVALREMVSKVVVDFDQGALVMHWRHDGTSQIVYDSAKYGGLVNREIH